MPARVRAKKQRAADGLFFAEGPKLCLSLPKAARRARSTPRRLHWPKTPELATLVPAEIAPHVAEKPAAPSRIRRFALFETPTPPADTLDTARRILMLEGVQDPGTGCQRGRVRV